MPSTPSMGVCPTVCMGSAPTVPPGQPCPDLYGSAPPPLPQGRARRPAGKICFIKGEGTGPPRRGPYCYRLDGRVGPGAMREPGGGRGGGLPLHADPTPPIQVGGAACCWRWSASPTAWSPLVLLVSSSLCGLGGEEMPWLPPTPPSTMGLPPPLPPGRSGRASYQVLDCKVLLTPPRAPRCPPNPLPHCAGGSRLRAQAQLASAWPCQHAVTPPLSA